MAKMDVKSAYPIVPVHPSDRPLLGVAWNGSVFVDAASPFGLRSVPKIFNTVADAVEWIARKQGVTERWHYLDDYRTGGNFRGVFNFAFFVVSTSPRKLNTS